MPSLLLIRHHPEPRRAPWVGWHMCGKKLSVQAILAGVDHPGVMLLVRSLQTRAPWLDMGSVRRGRETLA